MILFFQKWLKPLCKDNYITVFHIIGFALFEFTMIYNLTNSALWYDEWIEWSISQMSIKNGEMYKSIVTTFQPPLYNFLMHFWLKFNNSVVWFRIFNIVLGSVTGLCTYKSIYCLCKNRMIAIISLIYMASCYQWIYMIQDCSEYALMICCLSVAILFYILCSIKYCIKNILMFVLFCVASIYSQYGSFFLVFPLLILFFMRNILRKDLELRNKIFVIGVYLTSSLLFAFPLYKYFVSIQLSNNRVCERLNQFGFNDIKSFFVIIGKIICWFYNLDKLSIWSVTGGIFTVFMILSSILVFKRLTAIQKDIVLVLFLGYVLHFILTKIGLYAVTHPGISGGFYYRYSLFYIPIIYVYFPVVLISFKNVLKKYYNGLAFYSLGILSFIAFISLFSIMGNWHKTYDDYFSSVWLENSGWMNKTYLLAHADYGFNYYVPKSQQYNGEDLTNISYDLDTGDVPNSLWIWSTNDWSGDAYRNYIKELKDAGYTITEYMDNGSRGQLAYCECGNL